MLSLSNKRITLKTLLAVRFAEVSVGVTLLLFGFYFTKYIMDQPNLRRLTLATEANAIFAALRNDHDPALLSQYKKFPNSYAFRVYEGRMLDRPRLVTQTNADLFKSFFPTRSGEDQADPLGGAARAAECQSDARCCAVRTRACGVDLSVSERWRALGPVARLGSGGDVGSRTVYIKWAQLELDPLGATFWQLVISFGAIAACLIAVDGRLNLDHAHADAMLAAAFTGIFGSGVAYATWLQILRRLPAATASLGALGIPVVGVVSTVLITGEKVSVADIVAPPDRARCLS